MSQTFDRMIIEWSKLELWTCQGGTFRSVEGYIESYDPSRAQVWARVPDSGLDEVNSAVDAAKLAFPEWSKQTPGDRSKILLRAAEILESRLDEFAVAESRDQGKTVTQAKVIEIPRAVTNLRHFATSILNTLETAKVQDEFDVVNYTVRQPVGVAGLISPWNLPLYLLTFKIAPAIMAGNTVVCKPSEMTSVTAWMLCDIFHEAGLPPGVVNMVFGTGPKAGEALVRHPDVMLISFTGSTIVGQKIYRLAADHNKKLSLEMGGKNAAIIFDDAELEKCIPTTISSAFLNQGEVCLCTSRVFVQKGIYESFLREFVNAARQLKVGPPLDKETTMGALISAEHLAKVQRFVDGALVSGATVLTGYGKDPLELPLELKYGYFMLPTVVTGVEDSAVCMKEEIFGPVVCIVPFDTEDEVVERANDVKYGLCASVWSKDVGRVHRVAHRLQAGTVWCNCWLIRCLDLPFGGVKQSGLGREGTRESFDFYTEVKTVCVKF